MRPKRADIWHWGFIPALGKPQINAEYAFYYGRTRRLKPGGYNLNYS